jgi:NAD-dependent deacetylase
MVNHKPNLLIFTGAGVSAPSGIPTFRDANGLWHNHRIEDVCDFTTWKQNAQAVHEFYNQRRSDLSAVTPNVAHAHMAQWQRDFPDQVIHITSNVDNLLEAAGCTDVCHVHGLLTRMQCTACAHTWDIGYSSWDLNTDRCPKCDSRRGVKPGVTFFNEHAPEYRTLYRQIKLMHDHTMVLIVGTTGVVIDVQTLFGHHPGVKILNNLVPHPALNDTLFTHVFYESVETAIHKIDPLVRAHLTL